MLLEKLLAVLLQYRKTCDENEEEDRHGDCIDERGEDAKKFSMASDEVDKAKKYNRRAVHWANDCMADLIAPHEDTSIPALDALLMTNGNYDPMDHEVLKYQGLVSLSNDDDGKDNYEEQG